MKCIAISAASGKVGRRLPNALARHGLECRLISRDRQRQPPWVYGDLDDDSSLRPALADCGGLFFSVPFSDAMTGQARRLLDAAADSGIRHIVRLSAWRAGELPDNRMAVLHGEIDDLVKESGVPFTILRCNSFWQNLTEMYWPLMEKTGVLSLPEGDAPQAFIDAADIAHAAAQAFAQPKRFAGKTLDMAGPDTLTYSQALARLNQIHGTDFRFTALTESDAARGFQRYGLSENEIAVLLSLARSLARGDMAV